jgi:hypothetical protein
MFVIGLLSLNGKILLSTIPFLVVAGLTVREHIRRPQAAVMKEALEV